MENIEIKIGGVDIRDLADQMQRIETQLLTLNTNATPPKEDTELLTRKKVAELLGITLPTLHNWTKKGVLKSYRLGTRLRYKKSEVMEALRKTK